MNKLWAETQQADVKEIIATKADCFIASYWLCLGHLAQESDTGTHFTEDNQQPTSTYVLRLLLDRNTPPYQQVVESVFTIQEEKEEELDRSNTSCKQHSCCL